MLNSLHMISKEAKDLLKIYGKHNEEVSRPSWDDIFMNIAKEVSKRSLDAQTKYGSVLVKDNRILSTGYNSFIRGIDDSVLPNVRGEKGYKYPFMLHSELNCLLNCAKEGVSTKGATIYVTGIPCLQCTQFLWQSEIYEVVYIDHSAKMIESQGLDREIILNLIGNRMLFRKYFPPQN